MARTFIMSLVLVLSCSQICMGEPSERVHAFYYPWYANSATDGYWSHWNHVVSVRDGEPFHHTPPEQIGANFYPQMGLYSSNSDEDLVTTMEHLKKARVGVLVTSWWGKGHPTDKALPLLFDVAERQGLKIAFHLEPIDGRTNAKAKVFRDALVYLLDQYGEHPALYRDKAHGNRPLIYFYDSYLVKPADWATVLKADGSNTLRGTPYDSVCIGLYLKQSTAKRDLVDSGFDGFYSYFASDGFTEGSTPANWESIQQFAHEHGLIFIPSVAPGYDDTRIRPWNTVNQRDRKEGAYYDAMWQSALHINPPYISITSYDEWHEGTQIAPAIAKETPTYTYLDYAPRKPGYYLNRTAHWVRKYEQLNKD